MAHPPVVLATPADRARVVDTAVAAFAADPAFRYFFPDDSTYPDQASRYTGHLFDRRVGLGTVWIVDGGASVAMWDPPATADRPPTATPPPPPLPAETIARLHTFDMAVRTTLPATRHWYLGVLATHPNYAGRRWGRAVMTPGLRRAAAERVPAYLETASPRNVGIYRRAGWQVTETVTLPSLTIWFMSHPGDEVS